MCWIILCFKFMYVVKYITFCFVFWSQQWTTFKVLSTKWMSLLQTATGIYHLRWCETNQPTFTNVRTTALTAVSMPLVSHFQPALASRGCIMSDRSVATDSLQQNREKYLWLFQLDYNAAVCSPSTNQIHCTAVNMILRSSMWLC